MIAARQPLNDWWDHAAITAHACQQYICQLMIHLRSASCGMHAVDTDVHASIVCSMSRSLFWQSLLDSRKGV